MELRKVKLVKIDKIDDLKKMVSIEDTKKHGYDIKALFKSNERLIYEA